MISLLDLDETRVSEILEFCYEELPNVCLTCQALLRIAQPLLYANISIGRKNEETSGPLFSHLLHTLLAREDIADQVRSLKIIGKWPTLVRDRIFGPPFNSFPVKQEIFPGASNSDWNRLQDGDPNIYFPVLIATLRRLENLTLGQGFMPAIRGLNSDLAALHSLTLDADSSKQGVPYVYDTDCVESESVTRLFNLPSIKHINMVIPHRQGYCLRLVGLRQAWQLTSLVFRGSKVPSAALDYILSMAPQLKIFHYDYGEDEDEYRRSYQDESLNANQLRKALGHVRETLEYLTVTAARYDRLAHHQQIWILSQPRCHTKGCLGSLKDFPKLTRLATSPLLLLGREIHAAPALCDVLPPKLQNLELIADTRSQKHFEWDREALRPHLFTFLQEPRCYTPDLQTITLRFEDVMEVLSDIQFLNDFYRICDDAGVTGLTDGMRFEGFELDIDMDESSVEDGDTETDEGTGTDEDAETDEDTGTDGGAETGEECSGS